MSKSAHQKLEGISSDAVLKATGRSWDEWIHDLEEAGAGEWDHKQIVAHLNETTDLSGWWQQTVTVGYEKATGRRVVGQTADSGFQLGAQKTMPRSAEEMWELVTSDGGLKTWLGEVGEFEVTKGHKYATADGTSGEIRVVRPGSRIRLTWQRPDMERHSTLQLTVIPGSEGKSAVKFHHEQLPTKDVREQMKSHWKQVLADLSELV